MNYNDKNLGTISLIIGAVILFIGLSDLKRENETATFFLVVGGSALAVIGYGLYTKKPKAQSEVVR